MSTLNFSNELNIARDRQAKVNILLNSCIRTAVKEFGSMRGVLSTDINQPKNSNKQAA